jgi:hypothetical protein
MDDTSCCSFFAHPTETRHRRYEALRAIFLDQRPLTEVAQRFGYRYGTLRNLVAEFRAQLRTGQAPPFSPPRRTDDPGANRAITRPCNPTPRRPPTVANWP